MIIINDNMIMNIRLSNHQQNQKRKKKRKKEFQKNVKNEVFRKRQHNQG